MPLSDRTKEEFEAQGALMGMKYDHKDHTFVAYSKFAGQRHFVPIQERGWLDADTLEPVYIGPNHRLVSVVRQRYEDVMQRRLGPCDGPFDAEGHPILPEHW